VQFTLRCPPFIYSQCLCCAALALDYKAIEVPNTGKKKTSELRGRRSVQAGKKTESAFTN